MRKWGRRLVFSMQFLTRYPVNIRLYLQPDDFPRMSSFFPLDGALIGLFACLLAWVGQLAGSPLLVAAFASLAYITMSAVFQIDGLAMSFNVLGRRSRPAKLMGMKDPRLNARGIIVVAADILLSAVMIFILFLQKEGLPFYAALVAVPAAAKLGIVSGCLVSKSAKSEGIGKPFIDGINLADLLRALLLALAITMPLLGWETGLILCGISLLMGMLVAAIFSGILGGITDDTLGCINEICQLAGFGAVIGISLSGLALSGGFFA